MATIRYVVDGKWKFIHGKIMEETTRSIKIRGDGDGAIFEISKLIPYELKRDQQ